MTDPGDTAANAPNTREIKAGFVRLLSDRIRETSADPKQLREIVYELARVKLREQFTHADARESRDLLQILERAIEEVERSFKGSVAATPQNVAETSAAVPPSVASPSPPPIPAAPPDLTVAAAPQPAEPPRSPVAPSKSPDRPKRTRAFTSAIRLAVLLLLILAVGIGVAYWPRLKTQFAALSQLAQRQAASRDAQPQPAAPPNPPRETAERTPDSQKEPAPPAQPSMPLPTTFGVYAFSDGQLQELKAVPGKIPDRRVAISAAINTPSATTLTSGDVKFIVFRPDGGMDTSVTEVRVVAKVSRAMGVDAAGKAAMVSAGDAWVIRSMSYPYKVGPVEDQPRMLLLQPEQDGFTLAPGRYIVVVKGMGYDFTVAGTVTDPNQCVERINATNGAFYSPCPPPR
ncbi:hypothetical protein XH98_37105 [Bradyrhizobium sp. CCBAU 51745]|uniref:hypothetical protein n=1 Tax=Bradyrhizobium sp. CCBAU 51745 TaxID=1325099 RepID=UPI0023062473|nr:hypothetical protein [Bradyrhizobium sp. CCBAU 51745]MDA9444594.1 hypothetical protein [Bradyrhizobium sp. CCBAU 51745]